MQPCRLTLIQGILASSSPNNSRRGYGVLPRTQLPGIGVAACSAGSAGPASRPAPAEPRAEPGLRGPPVEAARH